MSRFEDLLEHIEDPTWRRRLYAFQRVFKSLLSLGNISSGNCIEVFTDREPVFDYMLSAISQAKTRVWLETYIFEPDAIGLRFRDALSEASRRGCEVVLIYDYFGSSKLDRFFLDPLVQSGAKVLSFNPIWPWRQKGPLLFRNHRKILIIDEDLSFCGSLNVIQAQGFNFRETVMKVKGPATHDLAKLFLDSFHETTGAHLQEPQAIFPYKGGVTVQVLASHQRFKLASIQKSMQLTLKRAKHHCYFTTPYFLPYQGLKEAMIAAAKRGIDVRVLTAGLSDVPLMRLASQHVYEQFLRAGIRIYELFDQTLHAKTATIDGIYAWVGSYNLDHWSARRNLEVNVSVIDPHLAQELESHFEQDLKNAREISLPVWKQRSYFRRVLNWVAYQIMRL